MERMEKITRAAPYTQSGGLTVKYNATQIIAINATLKA
jgi:hypothetical protein